MGERNCVAHLLPPSATPVGAACDLKEDTWVPGER